MNSAGAGAEGRAAVDGEESNLAASSTAAAQPTGAALVPVGRPAVLAPGAGQVPSTSRVAAGTTQWPRKYAGTHVNVRWCELCRPSTGGISTACFVMNIIYCSTANVWKSTH